MERGYQINDQTAVYFLTFQVINWVDVFTRQRYRDIIVENLNYCVQYKELKIYSWVIMSNHVHLICSHENNLSGVIRDFKSYTSKLIIQSIAEYPESRREWMLFQFSLRGKINSRNKNYQFWTHQNHAIQLLNTELIEKTVNYVHQNPVRSGWVTDPIHYSYSSALDYADQKGFIEIQKV